MTISKELLDELLKGVERPEDLLGDAGLMKELKIKLMERMLGAELTAHLGYEEGKEAPLEQTNRRNGVRRDGQKVLLSIRNMGGESTSAWRQFLDDLDKRGLKRPEFVIVDGASGLEAALVALWGEEAAEPALHGSQAPQPAGTCPETHARRADRGLPRHDLCRHRRRGGKPPQGLPAQE